MVSFKDGAFLLALTVMTLALAGCGSSTTPASSTTTTTTTTTNFRQKWIFPARGAVFWSPVVSSDGSTVYSQYYSSDDRAYLYAVDVVTGKQKWMLELPDRSIIMSSPALSSDASTVYVGSCDNGRQFGFLYAVDTVTGKPKWTFLVWPTKNRECSFSRDSSPALSPDQSTVYFGNEAIAYALCAATGKQKWNFTAGYDVSSTVPSSDGSTLYFVTSYEGILYAVDTATSKPKWFFYTSGEMAASPALSSDGSTVYVSSTQWTFDPYEVSHTQLYAVDTVTGEQKWNFTVPAQGLVDSSPALSSDGTTLYVGSCDSETASRFGFLYAVDMVTGKEKWAFPTGGIVKSSPALSSDGSTVYVGSDDHNLHAVDTVTGNQKWNFTTQGKVESSPALSPDGTTLYFVSFDHNMYAISTGQSSMPTGSVTTFMPEMGMTRTEASVEAREASVLV